MWKFKDRLTIAAMALLSLNGCSLFNADQRQPYYPLLRDVIYSEQELTVIQSDNILTQAITNNHFLAVNETSKLNQAFDKLFAEATHNQAVSIHDLIESEFHQDLALLIKQFSCELFASQQPADSIQLCPLSNQIVDNGLDYLPFQQGRRVTERLSVVSKNRQDTFQLELFLRSSHERSLDTLWGAVHELGALKGSQLAPESLVLTVNLNAYKKSEDLQRWKYLNPEPLLFFVVLPPVEYIISRPNEIQSMDFAYRSAKLLIIDSR